MKPYTHLLCPVDLSDISRAALEWSLGFAKDADAELTVLHVVDTGLLAVGNLFAVPDAVDTLRERASHLLDEWKRELDLPDGAVRTLEGSPAEAIVEAASDSGVDLLVMGTHGLTGFQKLILGSVTEKVLHRVRVPLLVLSSKDVATKGVAFETPRTILLAVDFGPESPSVIRHGVWLAEHYGARLVAAHGVPVPYVVLNDRTIERLTPQQLSELEEGLIHERREKLHSLLPESTGVELETVVRIGSAFETLKGLVKEREAGLVVMGAGAHGETGLGWLGSTCHKMVRSGDGPVLVVR